MGELHGRLHVPLRYPQPIAQRDEKIRVLANLEPIDPQVQAAGIGGPSLRPPGAARRRLGVRKPQAIRVDLNALIRRANLLASSFEEAADSLASHSAAPGGHAVHHADAGLAHQRVLLDARAPDPAHRAAARGHRRVRADGQPDRGAGGGHRDRRRLGIRATATPSSIDHGYGIVTKFAHASKLLVRPASTSPAARIALVGNTGLATGPHLHYEVHVNGRPVDPLKYVLPDSGDGLGAEQDGRRSDGRHSEPRATRSLGGSRFRPLRPRPSSRTVPWRLRRTLLGLEVLPRLPQAEDLGGDVVGEPADVGVVLAHGGVVVLARDRDAVLRALQLVLELLEVLAGPELG